MTLPSRDIPDAVKAVVDETLRLPRLWPEIEWSRVEPANDTKIAMSYRRVGKVVEFRFDEPWWLEPKTWAYTVDEDATG